MLYLLFFLAINIPAHAQLTIDTSYNFERTKKSFPIVFIVDTITSKSLPDSIAKNQLNFVCFNPTKSTEPLRITYALDKKEYINNGKDKLKDYLGVDTNSIVFNDAVFIELLQRKRIMPLDLVKKDANIGKMESESENELLKYLPLIIGSILAIFGIYALTKKNKTTTDMKQDAFLKNALKIQGETKFTGKKTEQLDEVLGWLQDNRKDYLAVSESYKLVSKQVEDEKQMVNQIKKEVDEMKATITQLKNDAAYTTQFNEGMQEQYLNNFQKMFASGSLQHPLNEENKQNFTETIYGIAFHYMSFIKSIQKRDDANDVANKEMLFKNKTTIDQTKIVPLQTPADIQKFNADILFIAEELKRNGVTELKQVNYKGYYFKS